MSAAWVLDFRVQPVGGPVSYTGHLSRVAEDGVRHDAAVEAEFTARSRDARVVVLAHGFNVPRADGLASLGRFAACLRDHGLEDPLLLVLWPGDGPAKALTYPFEGRDADDTAGALARWLQCHVAWGARLALVAHSLGSRVVMEAARLLTQQGGHPVERVCLMAPAIDNDSLGRAEQGGYREATLAAGQVAVLASEQDAVLRWAYPLGDLLQTVLFPRERAGRALGRTGPRERDEAVRARLAPVPLAHPARRIGHGDYLGMRDGDSDTEARSASFVSGFVRGEAVWWAGAESG